MPTNNIMYYDDDSYDIDSGLFSTTLIWQIDSSSRDSPAMVGVKDNTLCIIYV